MPKQRVDLLLEPELLARVEAKREQLRWSRTMFITAALEGFLDDAGRGVPDLPEQSPRPASAKPAAKAGAPGRVLPAGVVRGSDLVRPSVRASGEPDVDRFEKTYEYSAAMALWREGRPWEHLQKGGKE